MAEKNKAPPPATGRGLKASSSGDERRNHRVAASGDQSADFGAIRLLPNNHALLARRKGHAEAALIMVAHLDAPR